MKINDKSKTTVQNFKNSVNRPSPNNRLTKFLKITDSDCYIAEYVDFLTFYWEFLAETLVLWCRDNDAGANFYGFHLSRWNEGTWRKNMILKIIYYYEGKLVDIWQLNEFSKDGKKFLRVQLYGKGLLIINRENLRPDVEKLLLFFGLDEICLTRIDYAVDCEKINFSKKNTLNAKKWGQFHNVRTWEIEYVGFWSKGVSPLYLRYYNKKRDLIDTKYERLYPEYAQYEQVMRYELQVNSDGISPEDKVRKVYDLASICNFDLKVNPRKRQTKKRNSADDDFRTVQQIILHYKKTNNKAQLARLLMLLQSCQII